MSKNSGFQHRLINWIRKNLNNPICVYCGRNIYTNILSIDHKIPYVKGGKTEIGNLTVCCTYCNEGKDNLTQNQYLKLFPEKRKIYDMFKYQEDIIDILILKFKINNTKDRIIRDFGENIFNKFNLNIKYFNSNVEDKKYLLDYYKKISDIFIQMHKYS